MIIVCMHVCSMYVVYWWQRSDEAAYGREVAYDNKYFESFESLNVCMDGFLDDSPELASSGVFSLVYYKKHIKDI